MQGLLQEFSACIRCHNCMINCPICYCRECIFRTPTFEHESQLYFQWADALPKTRSGKIMRRVLKAQELGMDPGDISTLEE